MVLAAGLGTRLWPLTADRAKPAVPFLGRPLIAGIIEHLARHGVTRAVVNTHHLPESIHRALSLPIPGVAIAFSHEEQILGTAGALSRALADGLLQDDEATLVVNAKLYTDLDLTAAHRAHVRSGARVTMVLRNNSTREQFREVKIDGDRIAGFGIGRVPEGQHPLLFTGIHILEPDVVRAIPLRACDTVTDIYPPLIDARQVAAHVDSSGRWWEFSTLERYLSLHHRAYEEGIGPSAALSPGANVALGARVERSVLWENAQVMDGAVVEEAVLGSGVVIPRGETVRRAVVVRRDRAGTPERGEAIYHDQISVALRA